MLVDLIKSKLVIGFFLFGMILSFFMGLFSGNPLPTVFIRMLLSALIMGVIGIALFVFFRKVLSEEDRESLMAAFKGEQTSAPASSDTGGKLDITDDSELDPEEIFAKPDNKSDTRTVQSENPDHSSEISAQSHTEDTKDTKDTSISEDIFEETDLAQTAPKIQPIESTSGPTQPAFSPSPVTSGRSNGTAKIKVNNSSLEVDPETMAKAIRTVLSKD